MSYLTILLFFVYSYGLGFAADLFLKNKESALEKNIMRLGLGLGIFVFLSIVFALIGIPLDWRIFLVLSLIGPLYALYIGVKKKRFDFPKFTIKKSDLFVIAAIILAVVTLSVYNKGSFSYSWLEDDDSWNHAIGVKLISVEKSIRGPTPAQYIDPYPPGYDILMGVLHQTSPSIQWTMKFFNNLIIALSILFFYFLVLHFSSSRNIALLSTFFLFSIPSYLSHFIWAHSLVMLLFIVSLYCIEIAQKDRLWIAAASILIASATFVQPTKSLKFFVLFAVYIIVRSLFEKKINWASLSSVAGGYLLAILWYFNRIEAIIPKKIPSAEISSSAASGNVFSNLWDYLISAFPPSSGTATRPYALRELLFAQHQNMINNPIGIGIVLSILIFIGLLAVAWKQYPLLLARKWVTLPALAITVIYLIFDKGRFISEATRRFTDYQILELAAIPSAVGKIFLVYSFLVIVLVICCLAAALRFLSKENSQEATSNWPETAAAIWGILAFFGVNSLTFALPLGLFGFRFWMIFALFASVIAAIGVLFVARIFRQYAIFIILIAVIGVLLTSAYQKYSVNTALWPPGLGWQSYPEVNDYSWLRQNLPANTKVFTFVDNAYVIGFDMYTCHWCQDESLFRETAFNESAPTIRSWLGSKGYRYAVIDQRALRAYGPEAVNAKVQELLSSSYFSPVQQTGTLLVLRVN